MAFQINQQERQALQGLRYLVRSLYYDGIRPYMDYQTGVVGIKRKISWQSLREELYVEPQAGVRHSETGSPSKDQVRRAAKQLEKVGLIRIISDNKQLIFDCILASKGYFKPKQAAIETMPQSTSSQYENFPNIADRIDRTVTNLATANSVLAAIPQCLVNKNEISSQEIQLHYLSEDFQVTQEHIDLASQQGWADPHSEIAAFLDYYLSRGIKRADWNRTFMAWLRNSKRWRKDSAYAKTVTNKSSRNSNRYQQIIQQAFNRDANYSLPEAD